MATAGSSKFGSEDMRGTSRTKQWRRLGRSNQLERDQFFSSAERAVQQASAAGDHVTYVTNLSHPLDIVPLAAAPSNPHGSSYRREIDAASRALHGTGAIVFPSLETIETSSNAPLTTSISTPSAVNMTRRKAVARMPQYISDADVQRELSPYLSGTSVLGMKLDVESLPSSTHVALSATMSTPRKRKRPDGSDGASEASNQLVEGAFPAAFLQSLGINSGLPPRLPVTPPGLYRSTDICPVPVLPKVLYPRKGRPQIHRSVNSGNDWLYIDSRTSRPASPPTPSRPSYSRGTESSDPAIAHAPQINPSSILDERPWSPLSRLRYDPHNQMFLDLAPPRIRPRQKASEQRAKLAGRWNILIPSLIPAFAQRMASSKWNQVLPADRHVPCLDKMCGRELEVECVYFNRLEKITIYPCKCRSAPLLLMDLGLFPSAPVYPTLAVDLDLLDFAATHFKVESPNMTGLITTLELILKKRGHFIEKDTGLRRRFGQALRYYEVLADSLDEVTNNAIVLARKRSETAYISPATSAIVPEIVPEAFTVEYLAANPSTRSHYTDPDYHLPSAGKTRPSLFLQQQCPACHGGHEYPRDGQPGVFVAADGCATQRRKQDAFGERDHPLGKPVPRDYFLSDAETQEMKLYYEEMVEAGKKRRSDRPRLKKEHGIGVSNAVLDLCEQSYLAANDTRVKANTDRFADKGLVALVCRHDRPIYLVNMGGNGERRYFILALLQKYLRELPENVTAGFYYDVVCQLDREMRMWGLLPEEIKHLVFALPVFHGYNHQWGCQLTYNPRKLPLFGREDGENCERYWNLIAGIISVCRISGHHARLQTINRKTSHVLDRNLMTLAGWIARRYNETEKTLDLAKGALEELAIPLVEIEEAWKDQLSTQQEEPPNVEKSASQKAIESLLNLIRTRTNLKGQITKVLKWQTTAMRDPTSATYTELLDDCERLETLLQKTEQQISQKENELMLGPGMTRPQLERIKSSVWYDALFRARVRYERLLSALIGRRFVINQRIEDYRSHMLDYKTRVNQAKADKNRQPAISRCLDKLNKEILRMLQHWDDAPLHAIRPKVLDRKGLFSLDIDAPIWQTMHILGSGLGTVDEAPRWLSDVKMRQAITAYLDHKGCQVELGTLRREISNLHTWFSEEYHAITLALHLSADEALSYHLTQKLTAHHEIGAKWDRQLPKHIDDRSFLDFSHFHPEKAAQGSDDDIEPEGDNDIVVDLRVPHDSELARHIDELDESDNETVEDMDADDVLSNGSIMSFEM